MEQRRILQIPGGHNFRDMGGYTIEDGRSVKWRMLYRSGVMAGIKAGECDNIRTLGIVSICDFRTNSERQRRPTTWHEGVAVELHAQDYEMSAGVLQKVIRRRDIDKAQVHAIMLKTYDTLIEEQANNFAMLFRKLSEGRAPLVFNCSAGKDRTGVAAALVLSTLGVSRDQVVEDYLLTNEAIDSLVDILKENPGFNRLVSEQRDVVYPLLRAEAEYLENAFRTIENRYGGVRGYLIERLGVTEHEIEAMKSLLLE